MDSPKGYPTLRAVLKTAIGTAMASAGVFVVTLAVTPAGAAPASAVVCSIAVIMYGCTRIAAILAEKYGNSSAWSRKKEERESDRDSV